jgi:hypothetical protein
MERPSLDAHLGGLESEELIELNALLVDLQRHPAWGRYVELVELIADKAINMVLLGSKMPSTVDAYALKTADLAGYVRGLTEARSGIITKVDAKTKAVIAALERQREERT